MEREIDLKKISDGKLYTNKDMVKAGCGECQGCSDCCRGMGNSIFLDPMDIYRLTTGLECTFEDLFKYLCGTSGGGRIYPAEYEDDRKRRTVSVFK